MTTPRAPFGLGDPLSPVREHLQLLRGLQEISQGTNKAVAALGVQVEELPRELAPPPPPPFLLVSYPIAGGRRAVPSGRSVLDLERGRFTRQDVAGGERLSASLSGLGLEAAQALLLWADADLSMTLFNGAVGSGEVVLPQCTYHELTGVWVTSLLLDSARPYDLSVVLSSWPSTRFGLMGTGGAQERYADPATTNDFTAVPFTPTGGTVLASAYRDSIIPTRHIGQKTLLVVNTEAAGGNSADLNLQFLEADGVNWVDDPNSTGASTPVAADDIYVIESNVGVRAVRLRVRSTAAGSAAALRVSYKGVPLIR